MLGAGRQAPTQIQAVCAVRPIKRVLVYSRTAARREAFAREMTESLGIPVTAVGSAQEAVQAADVVSAITNSKQPVLAGAWLKPGVHVNAAGNNMLVEQEVDTDVLRRAWLITTDSLEGAKIECGDLLAAVEPGIVQWEDVVEIGRVVAGRYPIAPRPTRLRSTNHRALPLKTFTPPCTCSAKPRRRGLARSCRFNAAKRGR